MKFEDHCEKTKERIGLGMPEVHRYLDQYYPHFRTSTHWLILHHQKGIDKIVRMFGQNYGYEGDILVRQAAEGHVMDDMGFIGFEPVDLKEFAIFMNEGDEALLENLIRKEFP